MKRSLAEGADESRGTNPPRRSRKWIQTSGMRARRATIEEIVVPGALVSTRWSGIRCRRSWSCGSAWRGRWRLGVGPVQPIATAARRFHRDAGGHGQVDRDGRVHDRRFQGAVGQEEGAGEGMARRPDQSDDVARPRDGGRELFEATPDGRLQGGAGRPGPAAGQGLRVDGRAGEGQQARITPDDGEDPSRPKDAGVGAVKPAAARAKDDAAGLPPLSGKSKVVGKLVSWARRG